MKTPKEIEEYEKFYPEQCNEDGKSHVPDCVALLCKFHTTGIGCLHPLHPTNLIYLDEESERA
jgi:hypothetical protein